MQIYQPEIIIKSPQEFYGFAAQSIIGYLRDKTKVNLALPTGLTVVSVYEILSQLLVKNRFPLKDINIFMLDVLYPQKQSDPGSFRTFIKYNLLNHIGLPQHNFYILNSETEDPDKECKDYENKIKRLGGLDLAILGIGHNGHIAFNEPGSSLDSKTRLVKLTKDTIINNNHLLNHLPTSALTMGIKTILSANKIILLACGRKKSLAVKKAVNGRITKLCPASFLRTRKDVTFILDTDSASLL